MSTAVSHSKIPARDDVEPVLNETRDRIATGIVTAVPILALGLVVWQVWGDFLRWSDVIVFAIMYVATGFAKWGMTNAVVAARDISAQILDESPSWARTLHHRISRPAGALRLLDMNAKVGIAQVTSTVRAAMKAVPASPPEGTGLVGRDGLVPEGVATEAGQTCAFLAVCTHAGGILKWNDADQSFDCPLHGSRFSAEGAVLEGPATRPLRRRSPGS